MPNSIDKFKLSSFKLSSKVTVEDYRKWEEEEKKEEIASFVQQRFQERYLTPLRHPVKANKSGFAMMAICCLYIEALQSFREGWDSTRRKSELAFCRFFAREKEFDSLRTLSGEFYKHVRCGILHQAETTGGWRIRRDQKVLFNQKELLIDANHFLDALELTLSDYCSELCNTDWNLELWDNFQKKMKAIIKNCER